MTTLHGTCKTCAHYDDASTPQPLCKANPPVVSFLALPGRTDAMGRQTLEIKPVTGWPPVPADQWCGQWRGALMGKKGH